MSTPNYSKEVIKNRMYRHAMNYWGVKKVENLDPLVKVLLEALSSEIFGLSHDIETSQHRILDKIANMLTPDILVSVRPAHSVIHAFPRDIPKYTVDTDSGFFADIPKNKGQIVEEYSFYPLRRTEIYAGDVCRMICNGDIFNMDSTMTKELIYHAPYEMRGKFTRTAWIGLQLDPEIHKLDDLSFYFELPYREKKQSLYSMLAYAKWSLNGQPLVAMQGFPPEEETDEPESLFSICDIEKEINRDILSIYNNQFIRITTPIILSQEKASLFPEELKDYYMEDMLSSGELNPLYWFRVDFPSNFTPDCLEELRACINAVVVQNKRLNEKIASVNDLTAVVPLTTSEQEYFFSVDSVMDAQNRLYTEIPFNGGSEKKGATYAVRYGGCERMNSRDIKEYLYRVLDLLQGRGAVIASLQKDTFSDEIQEMDRLLNSMERIINNIQSAVGSLSYLLADLSENADKLYISYYTTICERANGLPVGMGLLPQNSFSIDKRQVYFLTTTRGGKSIPASANRFDIYKYILTTRDRIYTKADIINFCYKELSGLVMSVDIKSGVMVSEKPGEGLISSIDVHLSVRTDSEREIPLLIDELKTKLVTRSPDHFNYRIFTQIV